MKTIKSFFLSLFLVMLSLTVQAFAPTPVQIKGVVKDSQGSAVPGAYIIEQGSQNAVLTESNGSFTINVSSADASIIVSCIGYREAVIPIAGRSSLQITLEDDAEMLDEVIAIGYGTARRSSITGSIAKVGGEKLSGFPSVNVQDALQGLAAGVYVDPSRQPGDGVTIRIRGSRSLRASNDPLLIVDGMPGSWENLSSNDIKSIEILKDAAASAVYGSRAANGVILVTTKSASGNKPFVVEVDSYVGVNRYSFASMMSADRYGAMIRDVMRYQTHGINADAWAGSDIDIAKGLEMFDPSWSQNYQNGIDYNWREALLNSSSFNTGHTVALGYKSDVLSFRVSYSFQDDNSYYKTVNYKKHILNTNLKFTPAKWIDLSLVTRLSRRDRSGYPDDTFTSISRMNPFETPWVDEVKSNGLKTTVGRELYVNALWNYEPGKFIDDHINNLADIIGSATIHPLSWLTLNTNLKLGFHEATNGIYRDSYTSEQKLGYNRASFEKTSGFNYTWNALVTADKDFASHHISATAVFEAIKNTDEGVFATSQNIPAAYMDYHFLNAGTINQALQSDYVMSSLLSYLGRVQYDYKGKYILNAAVRYDGSSKLAEGNKWALFPSVSAAWRISEEGFLKDNRVVSDLKLRASYGEIGNQSISSYQTLTRLKSKTYSWAGQGFYTWQPDGLANKGLTWEVSKTINAGADFGFFKNRLTGTVEYYNTLNINQLQQRSIPETTGFGSLWMNIGSTKNEGFEISLQGIPIQTADFTWTIGTNLSRNWNSIVSLLNGVDDVSNLWFIGKPMSVYYDYVFDGIWQLDELDEAKSYKLEPGDIKVKDLDPDGAITSSDKTIIGQKEPKWMASLQTSFSYKNIDLSLNFVGQFGHMISLDNYVDAFNAERWQVENNIDWWTPLNPTNKWPGLHSSLDRSYQSTLKYFNGNFVKLQNITLGYDLSKLTRKVNISKLRVYLEGRNVGYAYKACPGRFSPEEPNSMYTIPSSYVFGINMTF